ncbi:serine/threonine protein kinase [Candidatus Laterigemmans baculatus]|uniref:serine/threonine protein kinase n=1 Tax=Candidatus Laterigemmans baculatus TaxID=2770505 RepID=UPI001F32AB0F|nr:serine/threonine protein kinase [Candidatus Laterigemmans baculatus]
MNAESSSTSASRITHLRRTVSSVTADSLSGKRLWIGPALTGLLIAVTGWWAHRLVEREMKANLAGQLQALLDTEVAALEIWLADQRADAESLGHDQTVRTTVAKLADTAEQNPESVAAELLTSPDRSVLREHLRPWLETHGAQGFAVVGRSGLVLAGDTDYGIGGTQLTQTFESVLEGVFDGETLVLPPFKTMLLLADVDGVPRAGVPVMYIATPVRSDDGQIIAALCVRIRPEDEFTQILRVAQAGATGDTYALNAQGVLLTNSRFDAELKRIGLLQDDEHTRSLLNIRVRDPGVDMTTGLRPLLRRSEQPLTRMAAAVAAGENGVDISGYRDYRGVPVVGAWRWLPEYGFGVATEVSAAEAFRPLDGLRMAFRILAGVLLAATVGMFGLTYHASRLERHARHAVLEAKRLGQYALGEKLGSGGMGVVYRARHDMLQRPTAIKLLHTDRSDEQALVRFEREVQLTSQLTHPNTIAIYDYGRTPEGVFYYAMEYLDGVSLEAMIARFGPLPEGRVIYILRQLCGSLSEAHGLALIHRDIKPANIMLTQRGGLYDFVKLLDFGLVKPQYGDRQMTIAGSLTGTPLYMSPEAIQQTEVDLRSDIYAVGAVGYFMLTGRPVFEGQGIVEICNQHIHTEPTPPSQRRGATLDEDLEQILMRCLAKQPGERPADASVLEEALSQCRSAHAWGPKEARGWWAEHLSQETQIVAVDKDTQRLAETTLQPNPAL